MNPTTRTPAARAAEARRGWARRRLAGALLIALAAAALPGCGLFGGGGTYEITAFFPRAVSVFETSDVRVLGLPAGEVREVAVEGDRVRVRMAIDDDVAVPDDVRAQIVPQSLIGERYIQLAPVFETGMTPASDEHEIPIERTIIPVEPDEALEALKEFLDSLDPDGLGRLVTNLEEDLRGNGAQLNRSLESLSELVGTFADKDDALLRIVDSFDRLTGTLATREQQLGEVLDAFAEASQVLADERGSIEDLIQGLAELSREGLDLIATRSTALREDIEILTEAASSIEVNLDAVVRLVEAGPILVEGLAGAYNPQLRAINLKNNFSPLITDILEALLGFGICLPIDGVCAPVQGQSAGAAAPAELAPSSPVDALVELLGAPTSPVPLGDDR